MISFKLICKENQEVNRLIAIVNSESSWNKQLKALYAIGQSGSEKGLKYFDKLLKLKSKKIGCSIQNIDMQIMSPSRKLGKAYGTYIEKGWKLKQDRYQITFKNAKGDLRRKIDFVQVKSYYIIPNHGKQYNGDNWKDQLTLRAIQSLRSDLSRAIKESYSKNKLKKQ